MFNIEISRLKAWAHAGSGALRLHSFVTGACAFVSYNFICSEDRGANTNSKSPEGGSLMKVIERCIRRSGPIGCRDCPAGFPLNKWESVRYKNTWRAI